MQRGGRRRLENNLRYYSKWHLSSNNKRDIQVARQIISENKKNYRWFWNNISSEVN